jgi:tetratricopeptide (TPR) repeat protein
MLLDGWRKKQRDARIFKLIDESFEAFGRKDMAAAQRGADQILEIEDEQVDALYLKGQIAQYEEKLDDARDFYERAILAKPDFIDPYLKIIVILRTMFMNEEAMKVCSLALSRVKPSIANLIELCAPMVLDFAAPLRPILKEALDREDATAQSWALYQHVMHRLGETGPEYEDFMQRMRARFPGTAEMAAVEAAYLAYFKRYDEAELALKESAAKFPQLVFFAYEQALAFNRAGRLDEGEAQAKALMASFPDNADFSFLLSDIKLAKGEIAEGLKLNESRFFRDLGFSWKYLPMPRWQGEPLEGKKLLVIEEQGFGDCIMFGRYIPELLRRGVRIRYVCREAIYPFFAAQPAFRKAEILSLKGGAQQPPDLDYFVVAISMAHCMGIDTAHAGEHSVYLSADPARVAERRRELTRDGRPMVGIVWAGNLATNFGAIKSIPAEMVSLILDNPDIAFVSLQLPVALNDPHRHLLAHVPEIGDFNDTAALIECLDAVVSVDTAVAHLSASMGQRTIVLSKFSPDWRWAAATPEAAPYWYPQVTVLRQHVMNDWSEPIARLRPLLADLKPKVAAPE